MDGMPDYVLPTYMTSQSTIISLLWRVYQRPAQLAASKHALLARIYLPIANLVRMRVAPVITTFSFYILLQSLITGIAVVVQCVGCVVQGCQGFLLGFVAAHRRILYQLTFLYRGHFQLMFIRLLLFLIRLLLILSRSKIVIEAPFQYKHSFNRSIIILEAQKHYFSTSNPVIFSLLI